ncbi:ABC transporter substrate-binding protein [Nocardia sp. XZ_19_385]|uniref:ABC transporter substrate-binding protein n=1 Tax=Nocardia sp. XZ_19_385 TaxID=2769488 RepID=UPI0018907789|nr:ABC transporter substrate-binding protein [Nocardia sp. XZ_19_385]
MRRVAAVGLVAAAALSGCSDRAANTAEQAADSTIELVDQRGQPVRITGAVEKVAFTVFPAPSIFAAVDRSYDRVVGINQSTLVANKGGMFAKIFPQSANSTVVSGPNFVPNIETLHQLQPDVVVQWGDRGPDITEPIEKAGFPVAGLKYGTQEDLEGWITLFAQMLGKPERGRELISWQHSEIAATRAEVAAETTPRPRAMILSRAGEVYSTTSPKGYDGFQFDLVGADLVIKGLLSEAGQVSPEQILTWNPEVIMISGFDESTPAEIYADPRLAGVSAVQNRRVYKTPLGGYRWQVPSAESPLMWQWMHEVLYPQTATGDLRENIRRSFDNLFAYQISEAEIDQVLRLDMNADSASYDHFRR